MPHSGSDTNLSGRNACHRCHNRAPTRVADPCVTVFDGDRALPVGGFQLPSKSSLSFIEELVY